MSDHAGLTLTPFRALRPDVSSERLGRLLCPPYDVIDGPARAALLAADPDNAVALVLPSEQDGAERYRAVAERLTQGVRSGLYAPDETPALYVYEMSDDAGHATRGLVGAIGLHDPADGIILPHENTMSAPVADRLALMMATDANLEPIYLVYDGGGPASDAVRSVDGERPLAHARTGDGITHRLWAITDSEQLVRIAGDLAGRRALIADGHHRYATYLELQARYRAERGPGPWDRGLTLLVDSSDYGPRVHAIHRVLPGLPLDTALARSRDWASARPVDDTQHALQLARQIEAFAVVISDGAHTMLLVDDRGRLRNAAAEEVELAELAVLDVTVLHRVLVQKVWQLQDTVDNVRYAHSVDEALRDARDQSGSAVLLRPTPVSAVAAVAARGGRMPRKSTLFTPKPASGLLLRRFVDEAISGRD